ncbi:enoyl-CoA hydratase/isomerase family protein [Brachybacterium fresconis]|uniref:Enoyl-CoA hydratase/carnithine racemase n=1 Tax=Brachybacterium fresconis TaxID=173363 RepID=A0ABS4YMX1_9MICO|nr:enoyl-CoA hydratase-related protein [Brachybacterium fresconis]MBP2410148.1 enoyl-CoA hydratase/carnithine racemase [Brachybacterium fresconis]
MTNQQQPRTFETMRIEVTDRVGTITLDRPEQRNALTSTMLTEITQVLDAWEADETVRGIVVTGSGPTAFAAGADISELARWNLADGLAAPMQRLYDRIQDFQKPTLAALNGVAMGGGLELAMACDIRIAADHARMGLPEAGLGVLPGAGGTQRLSRLVGTGRALEMILTGRTLTAEQAERCGLVTTVVPAADLLPTAAEIMATVLSKGPLAVRLAKLVIGPGSDTDQRTGLLLEQLAQTLLYTTEDKDEGAAAFLAKRAPDFEGR